MRTYIVFIPSPGRNQAESKLPVSRHELAEGLWAVGSQAKTSSDVCDELGIGQDGVTGIVVPMEDFYGYYDNALWQRLDAWSRDP